MIRVSQIAGIFQKIFLKVINHVSYHAFCQNNRRMIKKKLKGDTKSKSYKALTWK